MVTREADRSIPRYSLIRGVFFTSKELFPNAALKKLILPLVIEQVLAITVGLADTMMVSSVGEAAVSGVSLVDMLNVLIINIFSALATGGAVVVAQLLGARKNDRACDASKQLYLVVTVIALIISTLVMLFRAPLLRLLFSEKLLTKYSSWTEQNNRFARLFALAIFFPVAPDDFLCYLAGTTSMTWRRFTAIILLGKPLSIALYSLGLTVLFQQIVGWLA